MKIIAFISQKGGSGKSTAAANLAVAGHMGGLGAALIDLDPQASCVAWARRRGDRGGPDVIGATPAKLPGLIDRARSRGADLLILDTPPHTSATALVAADRADLILVPCVPSPVDCDALPGTLDILRLHSGAARVRVLLSRVPPVGRAGDRVAAGLAGLADLAPARLCQRVVYAWAWGDGLGAQEREPYKRAAREVTALLAWVMGSCDRGPVVSRPRGNIRT